MVNYLLMAEVDASAALPATSVMDCDIQHSVWSAVVPVELKLNTNDVATPVAPDPYYLLAPRIGYLPIAASIAQDYFGDYVASRYDGMWFKSNNIPLKWNLPIGVLYDLYGNGKLPWTIEVNYMNFPNDKLERWENEATIKNHFMNNLKEANHLKDRNNTAINSLGVDDQTDLWEAVKTQEYKLFWDIYPQLCRAEDAIKFLPVRIVTEEGICMMAPFTACKESGEPTLLKDAILRKFPQFLDNESSYTILVHGISPPLDTPLFYLTYHCPHPDNFVYIVVKQNISIPV